VPVLAAVLALGIPPASAQGDVNREIAKKHYELGEKLYQFKDYKKALDEFQKAYDLAPIPALMFNMGRCHEKLGATEDALKHYRRFLAAKPDAPNRADVEARIKALEERQAKPAPASNPEPKPATAPEPKPAPAPVTKSAPALVTQPAPATPPAEDAPRTWKWITGWVGVGLGAALLGGGLALGAMAADRASQFEDGVAANHPYEDLMSIDDEGRFFERGQIGFMVAGGVLAGAGAGLLLWELVGGKQERAAATAWFAPHISHLGAGLTARARF